MQQGTFRAPDDLRLGSVTLRVKNLELETRFYSQFLGMDILESDEKRIVLGFAPGKALVILKQDLEAVGRPRNAAGLYHFALLTPSREHLARALRLLLHSGYALQGFADHYVSEAIYLADPEGNGIEIYADRPRENWLWDGDHVRMGTIPLDIDTLLKMAGDEPPGAGVLSFGTVMGHIHLQVSNLPDAMAFYGQKLGFNAMGLFGSSAAFYSVGGYHHHIGLNTWASAGGPQAAPQMLGLDHYEMILRTKEQVAALADAFGDQEGLREDPEGIAFMDPSGILIKVRIEE